MTPNPPPNHSPELYDVHTHVGLDAACLLRKWWPYACMAQQLLGDMDRNRIHRAVCFPFTVSSAFDPAAFADHHTLTLLPGRFPYDRENDLLLTEAARFDTTGRLLPFAMFDPAREVEAQLQSLRPLVGRIKGLKTQTTILQSHIRLLLKESRGLMEFAMEHDYPVVIHTAVNPTDLWAQVKDCLDVAQAYPRLRFNLAHSLRYDEEQLKRAGQLPNVWVDCSAHLIHCSLAQTASPFIAPATRRVKVDYADPVAVLAKIDSLIPGRYIWGSDNPYMSWCDDDIAYIRSYADEALTLHALPESVRLRMAHTAPRQWLGLKDAKS